MEVWDHLERGVTAALSGALYVDEPTMALVTNGKNEFVKLLWQEFQTL